MGELHGVRDEVADHLSDTPGVPVYGRQPVGKVEFQVDGLGLGDESIGAEAFLEKLREVRLLGLTVAFQ